MTDPPRNPSSKRSGIEIDATREHVEAGFHKVDDQVSQDLSLARSERDRRDKLMAEKLDLKLFKRLFSWSKVYGPKRYWLVACVVARAIQIPLLAWAIGAVINGPIADGSVSGILWGAFGFFALALFTQVTMHYRMRFALEMGEAVVYALRTAVFRHLMAMPMGFYHSTKLGRIISRLTSDMENLRTGVQNVLFVSIVQFGHMIVAGVMMAFYNWLLFLVILGMTPILYAINSYFRKRIARWSVNLQESFSRITATVSESVRGIQVTQGFAREQVNADLFRRLVTDHSAFNMGLSRNIALYLPLLELNSQFFIAAIVVLGGYGALNLNMEIGDLVTFFFLSNLFFQPITSIGRQFAAALSALAGAERVFRLLDTEPAWDEAGGGKETVGFRGRVEFRDVQFHYEPEKPVLKDVNFVAEPGQTIALVGHTGSGKSTIINLVCKFYLPISGQLLFDETDIRELSTASLREQIGVVLQQNFLFTGSVMENIRVCRPGASDEAVIEAVRQLDCLDLVDAMPQGFQTQVTERGAGLSLGQRQVVCFARAMLADPRILILDEATSSVDTITEVRLQKALEALLRDRTCFVVAHRLSTIRRADKILVLDHGRIIEEGSHSALLQKDGAYASLYRQFAEV